MFTRHGVTQIIRHHIWKGVDDVNIYFEQYKRLSEQLEQAQTADELKPILQELINMIYASTPENDD